MADLHFTTGSEEFVCNILKLKYDLKLFKTVILAVFDKYYKGRDILFFSNIDDWHRSLAKVEERNKLCWYVMILHIIHLFLHFEIKIFINEADFPYLAKAAVYIKENVFDKSKGKIELPAQGEGGG